MSVGRNAFRSQPAVSAAPAPNPSVANAIPSTISDRRDDHSRAAAAAHPLGALPLAPAVREDEVEVVVRSGGGLTVMPSSRCGERDPQIARLAVGDRLGLHAPPDRHGCLVRRERGHVHVVSVTSERLHRRL